MEKIDQSTRPQGTRVVVTVISDLVTDQRVHKVCSTLTDAGYEVMLIGSRRRRSLPLNKRNYKASRINLLFQKKVFLYAEFNIRLFLKLLFVRVDIFLGNDLDVMPATFLAARLRRKAIVYDTHEYFVGQAELVNRKLIRKIWQRIEKMIFPRIKHVYTICDSFCELYFKDYGKKLYTVRNVPLKIIPPITDRTLIDLYEEKIPKGKKLLLLQGAGINVERGAEELVQAMSYLDKEEYHLLLVGGGDVFKNLLKLREYHQLEEKISIIPKVPLEILRYFTRKADVGLTLDKPNNINHIYGLPNKIFDYLHEGVPVISSRLPEMEKIITTYDVGLFIENHDPKHIAAIIREAFSDPLRFKTWQRNTNKVKEELNWEKESGTILQIFREVTDSLNK